MIRTLAAALAASTCIVALATPATAQTREYNIPAGSLKSALDAYVRQSGRQVVYRSDQVRSARSPGARGQQSAEAALAAILVGSGFATRVDGNLVAIVKAGNEQSAASSSSGEDTAGSAAASDESAEIVVTGTNIRGGKAIASPIVSRTRSDIEREGISTTSQLLRSLPQNFGGDVTDQVSTAFFGGGGDPSAGSGANLRGLGSEATLTLINGRRTVGSGIGQAVDLSIFPVAGLQRVDVLLDGASALYGSDAVGGVVNAVLRSDLDGAETRLRYGSGTDGHYGEFLASQVVGRQWDGGGLTASYTYRDQSRLSAADRSYTSGADPAYTLLPEVKVHTGIISGRQTIANVATIDLQALYSTRKTKQIYSILGFEQNIPTKSDQLHLSGGLSWDLGSGWAADGSVTYSRSTYVSRTIISGSPDTVSDGSLNMWVGETKLTGSLFALPGGDAKIAVGGQVRREGLNFTSYAGSDATNRSVFAAFGEIQLPFVSAASAVPAIHDLSVSIAGRFERYSDFGSSFDPKLGLEWAPFAGLRLRGTWGTSFRAPRLYELNPIANAPFGEARPIPNTAGGTTNVVVIYGSRPDLTAETSTTWTAGMDFEPADNLKFSATYFDVQFKNQVGSPIADVSRVLLDAPLYNRFLNTNPTASDVAGYFALPGFYNPAGYAVADIGAVIDNRIANTAQNHTSGIDASINYSVAAGAGRLGLQVGATYLIKRDIRFVSGGAVSSQLNDAYLPVDFKLRGGLSFSSAKFTANAFANYVDGYQARFRDGALHPVSSWTTIDLTLQIDASALSDRLPSGFAINLSALNIFNQSPPTVESPYAVLPIDFDGTNASPIGRSIALEIVKRW